MKTETLHTATDHLTSGMARFRFTVLTVISLAMIVLALVSGFPLPNVDDIFYIGPGMDLYRYGTLTNSVAAPEIKPFFYYPPYYAYILAAWFHMAGVSTVSLSVLQALASLVFVCAVQFVLLDVRRWQMLTGVPVVTLFTFGALGFRPDAVALALTASGVVLVLSESALRRGAGYFLMIAACLTAPGTLCYLATAATATVLIGLKRGEWLKDAAALAIAGFLNLIIFGWMIQWQFPLFLEMFLFRLRDSGSGQAPVRLMLSHLFSFWIGLVSRLPVVFLTAALAVLIIRTRAASRRVLWFAAFLYLATVLNILAVSTSSTPNWANLGIWLALIALLSEVRLPHYVTGTLAVCCAGLFALSAMSVIIPALAGTAPDAAYLTRFRTLVQQTQADRYLADTMAFRYLFDYNPPAGVVNWETQAFLPAPGGGSRGTQTGSPLPEEAAAQRRFREIHIISTWQVSRILPQFGSDIPKLQWGSKTFQWEIQDRYKFRLFSRD